MDVSPAVSTDADSETTVVEAAVEPVKALSKVTASLVVFGWLGVLTGLGLITAAAVMVDHPTVQGRFLPVFWVAPVLTIFSAARRRTNAIALSALGTFGLAIGAAIDLGYGHKVAGRYEFWLAASALLVTAAGWSSARSTKA
jgi:ABC-type antimicrobial peptide transport system permease subunit